MKNKDLSTLFDQMADIMEILGADPFRINSYRNVARTIRDQATDVADLLASGELANLPGIGKSSLAKIEEFVKTGKITAHEDLLKKVPPTLPQLLDIPGIGPKGVKAVYEELKVTNIEELEQALDDGRVASLHGFGEKKAATIRKGIEFLAGSTGRIRLDLAVDAATMILDYMKTLPGVDKMELAGSTRRRAETIGDVDILVTTRGTKQKAEETIAAFTQAPFVERVLGKGETKGSAIIKTESASVQVDVRVVPPESFGAALQYFTGSKAHNIRLREIAQEAKLKLNEYGLFKRQKRAAGKTEEEIYTKLGLDYVPPLLREDRGEIDAARNHKLPPIVQLKDIKGDFHMHTFASDGHCEIEDYIEAARDLGYKYICITDHSISSAIANGQTPAKLARQIARIHKISAKTRDLTIFAGAEVDILADGRLDFDDKLLADLDFVIGSIHSGLGSPRAKVTSRTLQAMDNPYLTCIGHPTGRLIGEREAMDLDIEAVTEHAAQTGTALEVNANTWRLDLKDTHCRMAVERGVKLVIGTDAHNVEGLSMMRFGVATAGRGWATKNDIINTLPPAKLKTWLKSKRP
jgi:DNA polymerase (family 10)